MATHFGLDLGSFSIKIIKARQEKDKYRLESFGEVLTPANIASDLEKDKTAIAEAVKKLAKEAKVNSRQVALGLPEVYAYSQVINLPYLSKSEIASAIKFEAEQYIPVPLEEVNLEYQVLKAPSPQARDEKMEILLVAAKKTAIEKILKICKLADIEPATLETETLAVIRALTFASGDFRLIVSFGRNSTSISLIRGDNLRFIRTLNTGGEVITRAIASELNMDPTQAEKYKITYGLLTDQLEGKVATVITSVFDNILNEIKQCLIFFNRQYPGSILKSVILSGGMALMPGLTTYLAKELNLEVRAADPFHNFVKDEKFPKVLLASYSRFSTAVGLAIRKV